MKIIFSLLKILIIAGTFSLFIGTTTAQTVTVATATKSAGDVWKIQVKFNQNIALGKIKDVTLFDPEKGTTISID